MGASNLSRLSFQVNLSPGSVDGRGKFCETDMSLVADSALMLGTFKS